MPTDTVRASAFELLLRFEKSGANRLKADSLIQDALARHPEFSESDRGFLTALVMGVLRSWFRLNAWMGDLTGRELKRIEPSVRVLLRLGLFQLSGQLSHTPAYAAINSTVELAKHRKVSPKTVKFINAVLREAQRRLEGDGFSVPSITEDFPGHLLWQFGWPEAWTRRLLEEYPPEALTAMGEATSAPAPLTIRVNTLRISVADYYQRLMAAGIEAVEETEAPEAFRLDGFSGSPRQLPGYEDGLFYVQDIASMWVGRLLDPKPGESVLDLCAAPGSKTTHMAALMENRGRILAVEPKAERLRLLRDNIARLGVTNVETLEADGLSLTPESTKTLFDKVLVDAPCSGTGTLRRHPEILLQASRLDLAHYRKQQAALLVQGFALLTPGGLLVYSTCSLLKVENHEVIGDFLGQTPAAQLESEEQRLITPNTDGFYAARIQKRF